MEGKWLLTSVEPLNIAILPNELVASMFQKEFNLRTGFYECLGRETIEQSDEEDSWDSSSNISEEEDPNKSYPDITTNPQNTLRHYGSQVLIKSSIVYMIV